MMGGGTTTLLLLLVLLVVCGTTLAKSKKKAASTQTQSAQCALTPQCKKMDLDGVNYIVQYGIQRTASTFQYRALCAAATLKLAPEEVACNFELVDPFARLNVVKTHDYAEKHSKLNGSLVFVSRHRGDKKITNVLTGFKQKPVYEQIYQEFVKYDLAEVQVYAALFDLSDLQTKVLHEYLSFWTIMRRCCGTQSSYDWRLELHNSNAPKHHQDVDYDAVNCNLFDLEAVQDRINRTKYADMVGWDKLGVAHCKSSIEKMMAGEDFNGAQWVEPPEPVFKKGKKHL